MREKRIRRKPINPYMLVGLVIILIAVALYNDYKSQTVDIRDVDGNLTVHYIDVGQGDATLLLAGDTSILLDAGRHDGNEVVPYLQKIGVKKLDLLVGTHPHSDHIGQMDKVLQAIPVDEVWMSGATHTSKIFEQVLDEIAASGARYYEPRANESFQIGSLQIHVIHPKTLTDNLNSGSISMRVQYGEMSFLFTGDAEADAELEMLQGQQPLRANVFHVGHHGSSTSNSEKFLKAVQPEIAIYSAGIDNSYGHPHKEVIERLTELGINVYGTDTYGTVIVTTDGKSYSIATSKVGSDQQGEISSDGQANSTPNQDDQQLKQPVLEKELEPEKIDINTASKEELMNIVHITEERAEELIKLRPFTSVNQLTKIYGIGSGRLKDIKEEGKAYVD